MSPTVFVTGANGFIAQHIVKQLLAKNYHVIGSVRDILDPAVSGTKNVLAAIKKYRTNITDVVYTSSAVAVFPFGIDDREHKVYTEADFNRVTEEQGSASSFGAYAAGKTFAERAVWQFVKDETPVTRVTTVLPLFVFGPQAYRIQDKSQLNFSALIVKSIVELSPEDEVSANASYFVYVRDVARAHLAAFGNEEAVGKRLLLAHEGYTNELIAHIISSKFPQANSPKGDLKKSEKQIEEEPSTSDASKTEALLGFKFIALEQSITDAVSQLLAVPN
ncbi:putative NADPH-dependent methylglyoxal reductase GRP2 [Candida viswanathii]|uniref:Putative NADPH-dependent methylglyoxal reductase GRP2 n=1 Tax=Candida viswanathii TaxID=5486 RepID=A0A367XPG9_9ASCO|nr:putative NADPH-dependent methylglyoxal reductase GRP2 [Candida viswanathii]